MRFLGLAASACVLVSCSGGSTSSLLNPTVVTAIFEGAGASPAAGDSLILLMSRDAVLTGAVLDDSDVTLSSGTLGTIAGPPQNVDSRSVRITLGAGVSFTPGTTTISIGSGNDAIQNDLGIMAWDNGEPKTIVAGDGDAPVITNLTLSEVDGELNGTGTAGGTLQVPPNGFTIDIQHTDPSSAIDPGATQISANAPVDTLVGSLPAGTDFSSLLTWTSAGDETTFSVPPEFGFRGGPVKISVVVVDATGRGSAPASFSFRVAGADGVIRPLEQGQLWFLDTSRDLESYTVDLLLPDPVTVVPGANDRPDLEDLFFIIGLFGSDQWVNLTVMSQLQSEVIAQLATFYQDAQVSFTFDQPGVFPSGASSYPYGETVGFSQICIAGASDTDGTGLLLGLAIFDTNNKTQDNDCETDYQGQRLGVFMHTEVNLRMADAGTSPFRLTYDPLTPARGGTPIGDDAQDAARLAGTLSDARETEISNAIRRFAQLIAFVTAHECGHSVGLVADGKMPDGLYGGDEDDFPGSTSAHILVPGLFPAGTTNVMSPTLSFDEAITAGAGFNSLNLAYLRERVLSNPQ